MPSKKQRISVVLEPRTYAAVVRLSKAGGASMASMIREVLSSADESLERMADFLEQLKLQKDAVVEGERAVLRSLRVDMAAQQVQAGADLAQTFKDLGEALSAPARTRSGRPGADATGPLPPVPVGRVRNPRKVRKGA